MKIKINKAQIDALADSLRNEPPPPPSERQHTTKEALDLLNDEITKLIADGHSISRIAALLKAGNLPISDASLRRHLASNRKKSQSTKASKGSN